MHPRNIRLESVADTPDGWAWQAAEVVWQEPDGVRQREMPSPAPAED